jgi:hypothetical protein
MKHISEQTAFTFAAIFVRKLPPLLLLLAVPLLARQTRSTPKERRLFRETGTHIKICIFKMYTNKDTTT